MLLEIYLEPTKRVFLLMFTQLKKTFNSTTVNGRANVAKATYGALALIYLFIHFKRRKATAISTDCQKNCNVTLSAAAKGTTNADVSNEAALADSLPYIKGAGDANTTKKEVQMAHIKPCARGVELKDMSPLESNA